MNLRKLALTIAIIGLLSALSVFITVNATAATKASKPKPAPSTKIKVVTDWTTVPNAQGTQMEVLQINSYCVIATRQINIWTDGHYRISGLSVVPNTSRGTGTTGCPGDW